MKGPPVRWFDLSDPPNAVKDSSAGDPPSVVEPEYDKLARACLTNARDHWDSAAAVASRSHFGQAQALSILGLEELARALHYRLAALGFTTFDKSHAPRETRVGGQTVRAQHMVTEGALHSQHEEKLIFLWTIDVVAAIFSGAIGAAAKRIDEGKSLEMSDEELQILMQPTVERIFSEIEEVTELNQKKKDGLYVGPEGEESTPRNVTEQDYIKVHNRLGGRLDQLGPFILGDWKGVEEALVKFLSGAGVGRALDTLRKLAGVED